MKKYRLVVVVGLLGILMSAAAVVLAQSGDSDSESAANAAANGAGIYGTPTTTPIRGAPGTPTADSPSPRLDPGAGVGTPVVPPTPYPTDSARPGLPRPVSPIPGTQTKTPFVPKPTPTIGISSPGLDAARTRLRAEAPDVLSFVEAVERGDLITVLSRLTYRRAVCEPRTSERPYEVCRGSGREMEVYPWMGDGSFGTEWQERPYMESLLGRIIGPAKPTIELLARRDDASYAAFFSVETRVSTGVAGRFPVAGLWFEIPPGPPPHSDVRIDGSRAEYIAGYGGLQVFEVIRQQEAARDFNPNTGYRYDVWWASQRMLDVEAERHRKLQEGNSAK